MFGDTSHSFYNPNPTLNSSEASKTSFLSLPNEILNQVVQSLAGEPSIYLSQCRNVPRRYNPILTIGLVNKRMLAIARLYSLFRHAITSERQLQTDLVESAEDLRRMHTRELNIDGLPIFHWLSTLRSFHPSVTHITLTNTRMNLAASIDYISHGHFQLVRHLSIQVSSSNEKGIAQLLVAFPNLVTLILHTNDSYWMDERILSSLPSLPYLQVLYRPPIRHSSLTFTPGDPYINAHNHDACLYDSSCHSCKSWCHQANLTEERLVTELKRQLPSLCEVFIPRMVFEHFTLIPSLPSNSMVRPEGLGWIEEVRRNPNVAIWIIENTFTSGRCPGSPITNTTKGPTPMLPKDSGRNSIRAFQPRSSKDTRQSSLDWSKYPRFWWSSAEDPATGCSIKLLTDSVPRDEEFSVLTNGTSFNAQARVLAPWDL